jgi:biotin carboxyl carrier protein
MQYEVLIDGKVRKLELTAIEGGWKCTIDGRPILFDAVEISGNKLSILIDGKSYEVRREAGETISVGSRGYQVSVEDARSWRGKRRGSGSEAGPQKLTATMPGKVVRILAAVGDKIAAGQGIVVIEAMKMQNEIRSPKEGTLQKILTRAGASVNAGEVLAIVE